MVVISFPEVIHIIDTNMHSGEIWTHSILVWPILLKWFNFNPSMDK